MRRPFSAMPMTILWGVTGAAMLICSLATPALAEEGSSGEKLAGLKKRVAVATFTDKSDQSGHWWGGIGVGEGMADMLTTALVKSGKYTVVERQEIERVLSEQALGQGGVVTAETAPQVGKMLGVELMIMGSVSEFGYKESEKGVGVKGIRVGGTSKVARVGVDVRFVNTTTGEILAAESVSKEESSRGVSFSTAQMDFSDEKSFDNTLVGKATRAVIDDLTARIDQQMVKVPWQGRVVTMNADGTVIINRGSAAGVKAGDVFAVFREGEDLVDPETGISLGKQESRIGTIEVVGDLAQGKAAKAIVKSGEGFQKGDIVRLP